MSEELKKIFADNLKYWLRMVPVTQEIIDLIGEGDPDSFIVPRTPDYITKHFCMLRDELGMNCRFHDLRHYYATVMADMMPRAYIEEFGGWSPGSRVLDSVYTNTLDSKRITYQQKTEQHLRTISHEISHGSVRFIGQNKTIKKAPDRRSGGSDREHKTTQARASIVIFSWLIKDKGTVCVGNGSANHINILEGYIMKRKTACQVGAPSPYEA